MIKFRNLEELKQKIDPLLELKVRELSKTKKITKDELFTYLSEKKWKNAKDLRFFEIVHDIIKLDGDEEYEKNEKIKDN